MIKKWIPDIFAGTGAVLIGIGFFLIWRPLGYIATGSILIGAAVLVSRIGGDGS